MLSPGDVVFIDNTETKWTVIEASRREGTNVYLVQCPEMMKAVRADQITGHWVQT